MKLSLKILLASLIAASAMLATSCHTIEGAGKDLESAGDAAEKVTRRR